MEKINSKFYDICGTCEIIEIFEITREIYIRLLFSININCREKYSAIVEKTNSYLLIFSEEKNKGKEKEFF